MAGLRANALVLRARKNPINVGRKEKWQSVHFSSCGFRAADLKAASPKTKRRGNADRKSTGSGGEDARNEISGGKAAVTLASSGVSVSFVSMLFEIDDDLKGYVGGLGVSAFDSFAYRPAGE